MPTKIKCLYILTLLMIASLIGLCGYVIYILSVMDLSHCENVDNHHISQMCGIEASFAAVSGIFSFVATLPFVLIIIAIKVRRKKFSRIVILLITLCCLWVMGASLIAFITDGELLPLTAFSPISFSFLYLLLNKQALKYLNAGS